MVERAATKEMCLRHISLLFESFAFDLTSEAEANVIELEMSMQSSDKKVEMCYIAVLHIILAPTRSHFQHQRTCLAK